MIVQKLKFHHWIFIAGSLLQSLGSWAGFDRSLLKADVVHGGNRPGMEFFVESEEGLEKLMAGEIQEIPAEAWIDDLGQRFPFKLIWNGPGFLRFESNYSEPMHRGMQDIFLIPISALAGDRFFDWQNYGNGFWFVCKEVNFKTRHKPKLDLKALRVRWQGRSESQGLKLRLFDQVIPRSGVSVNFLEVTDAQGERVAFEPLVIDVKDGLTEYRSFPGRAKIRFTINHKAFPPYFPRSLATLNLEKTGPTPTLDLDITLEAPKRCENGLKR